MCTSSDSFRTPNREPADEVIGMGKLLREIRLHLAKQLLEVRPGPQGVKIRVCLQARHARLPLGDRFVQQLDCPTGMRLPQNGIVPHRTRGQSVDRGSDIKLNARLPALAEKG